MDGGGGGGKSSQPTNHIVNLMPSFSERATDLLTAHLGGNNFQRIGAKHQAL